MKITQEQAKELLTRAPAIVIDGNTITSWDMEDIEGDPFFTAEWEDAKHQLFQVVARPQDNETLELDGATLTLWCIEDDCSLIEERVTLLGEFDAEYELRAEADLKAVAGVPDVVGPKLYDVMVDRVSYRTAILRVQADSEEEAGDKAIAAAANTDFSQFGEHGVEYSVADITQMMDRNKQA
jgi:hypothetical protein